MQQAQTIDQYVHALPESTQQVLKKVQTIIEHIAPNAEAKISYGVPTYREGKKVIHFGGYDGFISLYPSAAGIAAFADQLKSYETSKGTVRFYLNQPVPYDLIEDIVRYCFDR